MIDPSGNMYNEKRIGPRIDPCGTPQERGAMEEVRSPTITEKVLLDKCRGCQHNYLDCDEKQL